MSDICEALGSFPAPQRKKGKKEGKKGGRKARKKEGKEGKDGGRKSRQAHSCLFCRLLILVHTGS